MIDFSFFRGAFESAANRLRRHGKDHALSLLVGGAAALSVVVAGVAFAALGSGGSGGGGGGGAGATEPTPRTGMPHDERSGGSPSSHSPLLPGGDATVAAMLLGRAPEPATGYGASPGVATLTDEQPRGIFDTSFEAGSRPMIAMAGDALAPGGAALGGGAGGGTANPLDVPVNSVPEPDTYALMLAGLGLLGWQARSRKAGAKRVD